MAATAILDIQKLEILTVARADRDNMRHYAKTYGDR